MPPKSSVNPELDEVLTRPENRICADCGAKAPRWASVNLGVLVCIDCSGAHRNLGTHISVVKSVTLDKWQAKWLATVSKIGNRIGNDYYEHRLPHSEKLKEGTSGEKLQQWIRRKYERKEFAPRGKLAPSELLAQGRNPDALKDSGDNDSDDGRGGRRGRQDRSSSGERGRRRPANGRDDRFRRRTPSPTEPRPGRAANSDAGRVSEGAMTKPNPGVAHPPAPAKAESVDLLGGFDAPVLASSGACSPLDFSAQFSQPQQSNMQFQQQHLQQQQPQFQQPQMQQHEQFQQLHLQQMQQHQFQQYPQMQQTQFQQPVDQQMCALSQQCASLQLGGGAQSDAFAAPHAAHVSQQAQQVVQPSQDQKVDYMKNCLASLYHQASPQQPQVEDRFAALSMSGTDNGMKCMSGMNSATGVSGMSAINGMHGMSGMSGMNGMLGMAGNSGCSGMTGMSGMAGMTGMNGMAGMGGMSGNGGIASMNSMGGVGCMGMSQAGMMPGYGYHALGGCSSYAPLVGAQAAPSMPPASSLNSQQMQGMQQMHGMQGWGVQRMSSAGVPPSAQHGSGKAGDVFAGLTISAGMGASSSASGPLGSTPASGTATKATADPFANFGAMPSSAGSSAQPMGQPQISSAGGMQQANMQQTFGLQQGVGMTNAMGMQQGVGMQPAMGMPQAMGMQQVAGMQGMLQNNSQMTMSNGSFVQAY